MSTRDGFRFEYPDSAGYPDGAGFLDEGTAEFVDEVTADTVRQIDRPSADVDAEIEVHHLGDRQLYAATIGDREIATLRYDHVGGRMVLLTTTVEPEFRGRGIATDLIADVLDDIRERGMRVTVYCRSVTAFLAGNRQYADLIDPEHPGN